MSAEIKVHCPTCQQKIAVPAEMNGQSIACPVCGDNFRAVIRLSGFSAPPKTPAPKLTTAPQPLPADQPGGWARRVKESHVTIKRIGFGLIYYIVVMVVAAAIGNHLDPQYWIVRAAGTVGAWMMAGMWLAALLVLGAMVVAGYIYPITVARRRRHRNLTGVSILTMAFGWTAIGWVGALIWAHLAGQEQPPLMPLPRNRTEAERQAEEYSP